MKLKDMFISEEQFAVDSLLREVVEEEWSKESTGQADDFGDEPEDFGHKSVSVSVDRESSGEENEEEEFNGAPADPALSDDSEFGDNPIFDVPEPSADPDSDLWHTHVEYDGEVLDGDSSGEVSFPDYEGPKARSASHEEEDEPDEKGFYPRSQAKKSKKK